jgi:hypothetical protein
MRINSHIALDALNRWAPRSSRVLLNVFIFLSLGGLRRLFSRRRGGGGHVSDLYVGQDKTPDKAR